MRPSCRAIRYLDTRRPTIVILLVRFAVHFCYLKGGHLRIVGTIQYEGRECVAIVCWGWIGQLLASPLPLQLGKRPSLVQRQPASIGGVIALLSNL